LRVVDKGLCVDFHIHSEFSKHKESKGLIDKNTASNIMTLVNKLTEKNNKVNMCSITDHDNFDFELYKLLKSYEGHESIVKVLPGIEFTVSYSKLGESKELVPIHVVVLFNDTNEESLKKVQRKVFDKKNNKPLYDLPNSFSEGRFLDVLSEINLDALMIAHQKNSPLSNHKTDNDVNNVGEERLGEFLFSGYFEAFEFRNRKNEIFNNVYVNEVSNKITFITGSDCHSWEDYPRESKDSDSEEYKFTFLKCLPTFKGVAMALTDFSRIGSKDSFFSTDLSALKSIDLLIKKEKVLIPLSKGINVVIGDNSIGKSMLIHKMTDYNYTNQLGIRNINTKYDDYLKENEVEVVSKLTENQIYGFDGQGHIRKQFEENKLKSTSFFKDKYPNLPKYEKEKRNIIDYYKSVLIKINKRFELNKSVDVLSKSFVFNPNIEKPETVHFSEIKTNNDKEIDDIKKFVDAITSASLQSNELLKWGQFLSEDDKKAITVFQKFLEDKKNDIERRKINLVSKNRIKNKINIIINKIESDLTKIRSHGDKILQSQKNFIETYIDSLNDTLSKKRSFMNYSIPKYTDVVLKPEHRDYYEYSFVSKLSKLKFDMQYINDTWDKVFKKGKSNVDFSTITSQELIEKISNYDMNAKGPIQFIYSKLLSHIEEDFKRVDTIVRGGEDKTKEMSSGFNSAMYFDIISYDSYKTGVYVIDQPEDNVSQTMIKKQLIDNFRKMRQNRQVILITHNPQFVVNVDADNVIFISKSEETNDITICNGALEYESDKYNMLDIIADNLEGGRETINRRVRRYGK